MSKKRLKFYIVSFSLLCLVILGWINLQLPQDIRVRGVHKILSNGQHLFATSAVSSEGEYQNEFYHEMMHVLKSMDLYDYDLPIAAAMGHYNEWVSTEVLNNGKYAKQLKSGFKRGMDHKVADEIISKYKNGNHKEDLESYYLGAFLAGMVASKFGKDKERSMRYLFSHAMAFDSELSLILADDEVAYDVVTKIRRGHYLSYDKNRLNDDINELQSDASKDLIIHYMGVFREKYEPAFRLRAKNLIHIRKLAEKYGADSSVYK